MSEKPLTLNSFEEFDRYMNKCKETNTKPARRINYCGILCERKNLMDHPDSREIITGLAGKETDPNKVDKSFAYIYEYEE